MTNDRKLKFRVGICAVIFALSLQAATQGPSTPSAQSLIVATKDGEVQGAGENGILVFKGIPYAAPPVGELRWRPPKHTAQWTDVRKADRYGSACIQPAGMSEANGGDPGRISEDCLYLNIWTSRAVPSASLPVIVWLHGGAFIFGSGGLSLYDGTPLAARGAVVVSVNYRLMQLGFFAHPALEAEQPEGAVNFGLLDQIAALRWIRENVRQFGGDPRNVTIMGQSAGAKSVLALMASPLARGLFQKAVALSTYGLPDVSRPKAREAGIKAVEALGIRNKDVSADELRAIPAERFAKLLEREVSNSPLPISGDDVLPRSIQDVFADGKEAPVPLILGNTSDDASVALAFGINPADIVKKIRGAGLLLKMLYPGVKDEQSIARQATRDLIFTMPVRWTADRHSKLALTFRFYFDYTSVREREKFPHGVPHGAEIAYVLNTGEATQSSLTAVDADYADRVSQCFYEFARTGHPDSGGGVKWQNHTAKRDETLIFGNTIELRRNFMRRRLDAFIRTAKLAMMLSRN